MLTLRQALQLSCFEKARVVAGEAGLDQVVRRVHVVDIPDARYTWGQGALLLTAGYGLKDSPERQAALVPTLVAHGLVGLVLSTGWYFDQVPEAVRASAEACGFPVIEVPPEAEFIAISERLYVEIVNDQLALRERADDIHRQLTRLVLEGGRLADLAETLATFLQRSVLIESSAFEVLATAQRGPVDESRRRAVEAGRTAPDRALRLLKHGIYAELQQKLRPVRMAALPELGMTMERVVAPVVVGREIYGYIWIVAGDHPLTALDELAIDHAATVAALVMLKEQAVREAQHAVRGDFLTQMLGAEVEPDSYTLERAHLVGYQFDRPHQALFVMGRAAAGGGPDQLAGRIDDWLRGTGEWSLVAARERGTAVVIESKGDAAGQALAERLVAELSHPVQTLVAGVGGATHDEERSLRRTYEQALEAADIGERLGSGPRVVCFWDLGLLDWLYRLPAEALPANAYLGKVRMLAEHDQRSNTDMVRTLDAYLRFGGALAEAAAAINIHRNTLLYRLGRVEEITGVDLKDVGQRLNLYVALQAHLLKL
jgi:purine catabolism regulator